MAPVGSFESLQAAIQGGADSIYFGAGRLNMRARSANNFSLEDLHRIAEIAHENHVKTYLTLNIVLYDDEFEKVNEILEVAKKAGVDAIIAADMAVIQAARAKDLEVHISTQLNVSNTEALRFYAQFADVIVLARELNLVQIKRIYDNIQKDQIKGPSGKLVRLELFAHGALCMSVSGKCYLSLHEYNASANRGACYQICRRGYKVEDKETGRELEIDNEYIMSPKDLCTIDFLDKIGDAGIEVLKIEGRARSPEYVKTVSQAYKEATKAIENGTYTSDMIDRWREQLSTVFNRGFWDGYYLGRRLGEWSDRYGSKATRRKRYLGKGNNYFSKLGVAEFIIETGELHTGDEILITGPTTGVVEMEVKEIQVDRQSVPSAKKGDRCSIKTDQKIRPSDKLYKLEKRVVHG